MAKPAKARNYLAYADGMRVAAIFTVVAHHSFSIGLFGAHRLTGHDWWISNLLHTTFSWGVSVFVMLSGALLLDPGRNESLFEFYGRRVSRVGIPLIFWILFYFVWTATFHQYKGLTLKSMIVRIFYGDPHYHLHFLFLILGLYLFTPIFRPYVRQAERKELKIISVLFFLVATGMWFFTNYVAQSSKATNAFTRFLPHIGYFFTGYLLRNQPISPRLIRNAALAAVSGLGLIVVGTGLFFRTDDFILSLSSTVSPFGIVLSISVFILLKAFFSKFPFEHIMQFVAPLTFGIYLIHVAALDVLRNITAGYYEIHPLLTMTSQAILAFILSIPICFFIQKIPAFRRVIG